MSSRMLRSSVGLAMTSLLVAGGATSADVARTLQPPFTQVTGEVVTGVPDSPSCATVIVRDKAFADTYGDQRDPANRPFTGDYIPTCRGPWSKVVLTMSARVEPTYQYDRIGDVRIGGAQLLRFTTPLGRPGRTTWQVERDVSHVAGLFTRRQPVHFLIGNTLEPPVTGVFYASLRLTFYSASRTAPPAGGVDLVLPGPHGTATRTSAPRRTVRFPRHLTRVEAEVFTSGHGSKEEVWWVGPIACSSSYREMGLYVDGRRAGLAPLYPTMYTGTLGPERWRPIPGLRAFHLRPYRLDLTPFVGLLTDGRTHTVAVRLYGQDSLCASAGGGWLTDVNLLGWVNHRSTGRTLGALRSASLTGDSRASGKNQISAQRRFAVVGWTHPARGGRVVTTVTGQVQHSWKFVEGPHEQAQTSEERRGDWRWITSTTTTAGGHSTVDSVVSVYGHAMAERWAANALVGAQFDFVDDWQSTTSVDGRLVSWRSLDNRMMIRPLDDGTSGLYSNRTRSRETWRFRDSSGECFVHELAAVTELLVQDDLDADC